MGKVFERLCTAALALRTCTSGHWHSSPRLVHPEQVGRFSSHCITCHSLSSSNDVLEVTTFTRRLLQLKHPVRDLEWVARSKGRWTPTTLLPEDDDSSKASAAAWDGLPRWCLHEADD